MILIDTPSFIATTTETQTPVKLNKIIVNYSTMLGQKDGNPQGYINSYIGTLNNEYLYSLGQVEIEQFGGNILSELHGMYIAHLSGLNPTLNFTSTL